MAGEPDTSEANGTSGTDMSLALIEEQADTSIRRVYQDGHWFFSVIDVIGVLTDAPTPRMYWADMKRRIYTEGFREVLALCQHLKMPASDGKNYRTDAADTETMLRIIQSVPSPKAEPVKQGLARVGARRLEEVTRLVPEILQRLGPQTLTPEHQATIKHQAARLHELTGASYAALYGELNAAFHVGRYSDIAEARWPEIAAWFKTRIAAAEKRGAR